MRWRSTIAAAWLVLILGTLFEAGHHLAAVIGLVILALGYAIEADISRRKP